MSASVRREIRAEVAATFDRMAEEILTGESAKVAYAGKEWAGAIPMAVPVDITRNEIHWMQTRIDRVMDLTKRIAKQHRGDLPEILNQQSREVRRAATAIRDELDIEARS